MDADYDDDDKRVTDIQERQELCGQGLLVCRLIIPAPVNMNMATSNDPHT